jgi:hypothetical protein
MSDNHQTTFCRRRAAKNVAVLLLGSIFLLSFSSFGRAERTAAQSDEPGAQDAEKEERAMLYRPPVADFLPLVAYGARVEDFGFIREIGFNGVVIEVNAGNADEVLNAAMKEGLKLVVMDRHSVPVNPARWLGSSMDEAKPAEAPGEWAMVRIAGGQTGKGEGWGRVPAYDEMKALSYLAIVHGARGLFFSIVSERNDDLRRDAGHLEDVKRLVRELGALSPYFINEVGGATGVSPDSFYGSASDGTRPVHARTVGFGRQKITVAVNVLDRAVKVRLAKMGSDGDSFDEYFSGAGYMVKDGNVVDEFGPHGVKLYIAGKEFRKVKILEGATGRVKGRFYTEVADTAFQKTVGLMFRKLPSEERALLLVAGKSEDIMIHAPNMLIPFDIVFFDSDDRVTAVQRDVKPCTDQRFCSQYGSPVPSKMVLETVAGVVDKLGIEAGDRLEFY